MQKVNPRIVGLVFASMLAALNLIWAVIVALGAGQTTIDAFARLHFIRPDAVVLPFDFAQAFFLICVMAVVGFIIGTILGSAWNRFVKSGK